MKIMHYAFKALAVVAFCAVIFGATHQIITAGICALMAAATGEPKKGEGE